MSKKLLTIQRVLKENEILKEEKAQAWEEWNNLEKGSYETEQRLKRENEELKSKNKTLEELLQGNLYELYKYYKELAGSYQGNCIPVQKVKDKIRHYQELQDNYIKKYDEINEGLQAMINVLQELIEEREEK